ncbi:MAG TPA: hypothetical protein VHC67_02005 [Gaiellaceae bacterium]|nr:hypothetical protein [Gaiellaceae bacterium]
MKPLLACLVAALAVIPSAAARHQGGAAPAHVAAPGGLHAFLLSPSEQPLRYYPRTPSFSWSPVGAHGGTYDFELATSRSFGGSSVLFDYTKLKIPAVAVAHQLPWMTGSPYALWVHVRWESADGKVVTPWSKPFGFNMRWSNGDVPQQEPAPPGLIRWKPIEGATAYQVLYPQIENATAFETTTNVADEREFYTFRSPPAVVQWRVRAVRYVDDTDVLKNGLPRTSYGPWSPVFSTPTQTQPATAKPMPAATVSDTWDRAGRKGTAHDLTPGFAWSPSPAVVDPYIGPVGSSLYRVYIFTDDHCVNQIFAGSVVGSPAFAPRVVGGPFNLPQDTETLASWDGPPFLIQQGSEGRSYDATGQLVTPNESPGSKVSASSPTAKPGSSSPSSSSPTTASGGAAGSGSAQVDLWDSGWPSGRFYWAVVPVEAQLYGVPPQKASTSLPIEYHDTAVAQDVCQAGDGMSFGKVSEPVVTAAGTPFVAGLAPNGRVVASAAKVPQLHDSPLVAWKPAIGATTYEIQLSRRSYPWRTTWSATTPATSVTLPLGQKQVGTWWYRVRGINPALPQGAQQMSWSKPVRLQITGDSFVVVK